MCKDCIALLLISFFQEVSNNYIFFLLDIIVQNI